jgi:hypothetical protein
MANLLRKLFHAEKSNRGESDTINVLVSLRDSPDNLCLADLRQIGLIVKSVEGNKLIGEIAPVQLSKLESHANVMQVERSVKLKPSEARAQDN